MKSTQRSPLASFALRTAAASAFAATTLIGASAFACSPVDQHPTELTMSEAPDCLVFDGNDGFSEQLGFTNDCESEARIAALDCDDCGEPIVVAAGESGSLEVPFPEQAGTETLTLEFSLTPAAEEAATDGEMTVELETVWTEDPCGGCSTASGPVESSIFALFVFGVFGVSQRRRRRR